MKPIERFPNSHGAFDSPTRHLVYWRNLPPAANAAGDTNQIREFLSRIGANDRVLLIGDIRQHQGVEPGRPFEQLQEAGMRTAKLDEIVRQKNPALKSAVELSGRRSTLNST
jgi:hypothetical protein